MSFFPLDPFPPEPVQTPVAAQAGTARTSNAVAQRVIDTPRTGHIVRELLTWRTPHLGYVKMYLNPQELQIEQSKDITSARTKGGFVVQYAGENLITININGTTGSGGIEAINILKSVFRSEQEAFEGIAQALDERLSVLQSNTLTGLNSIIDPNLFALTDDALRNFGRPQPTLASLATNIEMYFQGELYRGYFTKFGVSETADSAGLFRYNLTFNAYAQQGVRRNFMPWHRQPINPAETPTFSSNPLSFPDIFERVEQSPQLGPVGSTRNRASGSQNFNLPNKVSPGRRATSVAVGSGGLNLVQSDLRKTNGLN